MAIEREELEALLRETRRLRDRFSALHPTSARLPILIKDTVRLERLLREAA